MFTDTPVSVSELAQTYAAYFAEDFALKTMHYLNGSFPAPSELIQSAVRQRLQDVAQATPLVLAHSNSVTRFVYECAEHAIQEGVTDPEDRSQWDRISNLPSQYHADLHALSYASAGSYRRTLDTTLGVVTKDARVAVETIQQAVQARASVTETGGTMHSFSWGVLSNGLWLNQALMKAYDKASIFKPGEPVQAYFAKTAFDFAFMNTAMPSLSETEQMHGYGELNGLYTLLPEAELSAFDERFPQSEINKLLFTPGVLHNFVKRSEEGLSQTAYLVESVDELSQLARLLPMLMDVVPTQAEEARTSLDTQNRLAQVNDVVTMMLVGYEALRESKFSESLIMRVDADAIDPTVSVIVNQDLMNSYRAAHGSDEELVQFGNYLDPRKGISTPTSGWSLTHVLTRKDDVVAQVAAAEQERLQALRSNDAAVIRSEAERVLMAVVDSYCEAADLSVNSSEFLKLKQRVQQLSFQLTGTTPIVLEDEVIKLLVSVVDDSLLTQVTDRFLVNTQSDDQQIKQHAGALALAEVALSETASYITK